MLQWINDRMKVIGWIFILPLALVFAVWGVTGIVDFTSAQGRGLTVTLSGEDAAHDGFSFPSGSEVTFVDGWELHFEHVLVTVGAVTLSENPDRSPLDQSSTDAVVAREDRPVAVDLTAPGDAPGAGQAKLAATAMGGAAAIRAGWHAIGGIGDACARNPEG